MFSVLNIRKGLAHVCLSAPLFEIFGTKFDVLCRLRRSRKYALTTNVLGLFRLLNIQLSFSPLPKQTMCDRCLFLSLFSQKIRAIINVLWALFFLKYSAFIFFSLKSEMEPTMSVSVSLAYPNQYADIECPSFCASLQNNIEVDIMFSVLSVILKLSLRSFDVPRLFLTLRY